MDLQRVSSGYVVPSDASPDTASAIMDDADATVEEFATILAAKLEADIPPHSRIQCCRRPARGDDDL